MDCQDTRIDIDTGVQGPLIGATDRGSFPGRAHGL